MPVALNGLLSIFHAARHVGYVALRHLSARDKIGKRLAQPGQLVELATRLLIEPSFEIDAVDHAQSDMARRS